MCTEPRSSAAVTTTTSTRVNEPTSRDGYEPGVSAPGFGSPFVSSVDVDVRGAEWDRSDVQDLEDGGGAGRRRAQPTFSLLMPSLASPGHHGRERDAFNCGARGRSRSKSLRTCAHGCRGTGGIRTPHSARNRDARTGTAAAVSERAAVCTLSCFARQSFMSTSVCGRERRVSCYHHSSECVCVRRRSNRAEVMDDRDWGVVVAIAESSTSSSRQAHPQLDRDG